MNFYEFEKIILKNNGFLNFEYWKYFDRYFSSFKF